MRLRLQPKSFTIRATDVQERAFRIYCRRHRLPRAFKSRRDPALLEALRAVGIT